MTTETDILQSCRLAVGRLPDVRLWRNNSGLLYDAQGRPVRFGVGERGGSDLIGLKRVVITPEMIGKTLAVFAAVEVKTETGRVRPEQAHFIDFVSSFGGIAGVVRSPEEAVRLVTE